MDRPWPYSVGIWILCQFFIFFSFVCFAVPAVISKLSRDVLFSLMGRYEQEDTSRGFSQLQSAQGMSSTSVCRQTIYSVDRLFTDTRLLTRKERWCTAPAQRWHISATPPARWGRTPPRCRCEVRACPAAMLPGRSKGCRPAWTPLTASLSHLHAVDRSSRHLHQQPNSDQWF